jgi:hypothetical protein
MRPNLPLGVSAFAVLIACAATTAHAQTRVVQLDSAGDPPDQPYVGGAYVAHIAENRLFAAGWSTLMGDGGPIPMMWNLTTGEMIVPPYLMGWPTSLRSDGGVMTTSEDWLFGQGALRWNRVTGGTTWIPTARYSESGDGLRRAEVVGTVPAAMQTSIFDVATGALVATVPGDGDIGPSGRFAFTSTHAWFEGSGVTDLRPHWPSGAWLSDIPRFMSPDGSVFGGMLVGATATAGFLWRNGVVTVTPGVVPISASQHGSVLLQHHAGDPNGGWGWIIATRITTPRYGEQPVGDFLALAAPNFNPPGVNTVAVEVSPDGLGLVVFAYGPNAGGFS